MVQEAANNARSTATGDGNYSYTFTATIPADARGSWAVGVEGYFEGNLRTPSGGTLTDDSGRPLVVRDVGFNVVAYGAVTDAQAQPRKKIVELQNCNTCHQRLAFHGGGRVNTDYCVLCHNANMTDVGKRTTAGGPNPPESVQFTRMIHKIHTGQALNEKPYIIYGGSPANPGPIDMSTGTFPTERTNCTKCHLPGSNLLSFMRTTAAPTTVRQGDVVVSSIPPVQNACNSCHDSSAARAHSETQTTSSGREACAVCHNENREFPVSSSHAQ
jgi:OmcA/MtrC family decaheme c-type cytochrome